MPRQHGAWFILALPVVVGLVLRIEDAAPPAPGLETVVACWLTGYLAFSAMTTWLKAPVTRRPAARTPLLTWTLLAAALGVASLVLSGPGLLGWVPPFALLVAPALWLAATRRERSVASGALTVAAASLMTLVTRFVTPGVLLDSLGTPPGTSALVHAALVFTYLFGTVLHVKTMIRERGHTGWFAASVGWHAAATVGTAVAAVAGALPAGWAVLFGLTVARAWLLPRLAARRTVRPVAVGLVEIGLSAGFVVVTALG